MLYFTELILRILYIFFSLSVTCIILYLFKDEIYFYLIYKESFNYSFYSLDVERSFILRSPWELINVEVCATFFLAVIFIIPFFLFNTIFFLSSGLSKQEYLSVKKAIVETTVVFYVSNIAFTFFFFPYLFPLIENFVLLERIKSFNIEYQPGIEFLLNFYNETLFYFNFFIFLFFIFRKVFKKVVFFRNLKLFLIYIVIFLYFFAYFSFTVLTFYAILTYFFFNYYVKYEIIKKFVLEKTVFIS